MWLVDLEVQLVNAVRERRKSNLEPHIPVSGAFSGSADTDPGGKKSLRDARGGYRDERRSDAVSDAGAVLAAVRVSLGHAIPRRGAARSRGGPDRQCQRCDDRAREAVRRPVVTTTTRRVKCHGAN